VHPDAALGPAFEVGTIILRVEPVLGDSGAGEIGKILALRDPDSAAFKDRQVAAPADEATGCAEPIQRLDPGFAAGRDTVPTIARQSETLKLPGDGVGRSRCISDEA